MMRSLLRLLVSISVAMPVSAQEMGRILTPRLQTMIEGESLDLYGSDVYAFTPNDGGLVLGDPRGLRLLMIDSGGNSHEIGRTGEGPGEFRNIRNIGPNVNGGLWASDSRLLRFQIFDSHGQFERAYSYSQRLSLPPSAAFIQWPVALPAPSKVLMRAALTAGDGGKLTAGHQSGDDALVLMDLDGGNPSPLLWRTESDRCTRTANARTVPLPFCVSSLLDVSPTGATAVVVTDRGDDGIHGMIGVALARLSDPASITTLEISTGDRRHVAEAERDSVRRRAALRFRLTPASMALYDELLKDVKFYPSADRVFVADDQIAWVGLPKDDGRTWLLIGPAGKVVGNLSLPFDEQPIAATGDTLWTARPNDDGFVDLRKYQIM